MDYIYLTEKSVQETKREIDSDKILLPEINLEDRIWIVSKRAAEEESRNLQERSMKKGA